MLKPIETEYKGYRFRSRTEARWAVFFDSLGLRYEYEKEGYDLDEAGWYLPDFWLPKQKCWVEVKGVTPTEAERNKAKALARNGRRPVWILVGLANYDPEFEEWNPHYRINAEMYFFNDLPDWYAKTAIEDPDEYGGIEHVERNIRQGCSDSNMKPAIPFPQVRINSDYHIYACSNDQFISAYKAAKGARFERVTA